MNFPPPTIPHCPRHPNREAGRNCTRCGRPACSDCLQQASVGSICIDCRKAAAPSVKQRATNWDAKQHSLITRALIAANVAVFIWVAFGGQFSVGVDQVNRRSMQIALFGPAIADGEYYRIITSGFLHYGLLHIGMNMFLLFQLGQMLEPALGRGRFAMLYFTSLVGGAAGALLLDPRAFTGGASGAVFGLMGAAVIALKMQGVNPWRTGLGATLLLNLVITFSIPGISVGGHIGGVVAGATCGWAMFLPSWRRGNFKEIMWIVPIAILIAGLVLCLVGANQ